MSDDRSAITRRRLIDATMRLIRQQGVAKVTARSVAAEAGVNQALVFYHFGTVTQLIAHSCLTVTAERVDAVAHDFAEVQSFADLVRLATVVHAREREAGHVAVLAQVLSAAHADPALADAARQALDLWLRPVRETLYRLVPGSVVDEMFDVDDLAEMVSAGFVGAELMEPVRGRDLSTTLAPIERLAAVIDRLGPVSRRAIRAALRER